MTKVVKDKREFATKGLEKVSEQVPESKKECCGNRSMHHQHPSTWRKTVEITEKRTSRQLWVFRERRLWNKISSFFSWKLRKACTHMEVDPTVDELERDE